jgi:hypothetical protein
VLGCHLVLLRLVDVSQHGRFVPAHTRRCRLGSAQVRWRWWPLVTWRTCMRGAVAAVVAEVGRGAMWTAHIGWRPGGCGRRGEAVAGREVVEVDAVGAAAYAVVVVRRVTNGE